MMDHCIVIVAEHSLEKVAPATYKLLEVAQEIRQVRPCEIRIVVLGAQPRNPAREIAEHTQETVIAFKNPGLTEYNAEMYKDLLQEEVPRFNLAFNLVSQVHSGRVQARMRYGVAGIRKAGGSYRGHGTAQALYRLWDLGRFSPPGGHAGLRLYCHRLHQPRLCNGKTGFRGSLTRSKTASIFCFIMGVIIFTYPVTLLL
ncbi:MAG: hypothetical protein ACQEQ7_14230 [Thermodesulfobacteriota bacterium]